MKQKTFYICEKCKKESRVKEEIEICEAEHLGLTLQEKREYNRLADEVKWRMWCQSNHCNDYTRSAADKAINDIIAFEKKYGIE